MPLSTRIAQIKVCLFFRKMSLRVKSEIPLNKPLPQARLIGQIDLVHFVAWQLMGGIDFPQKFLCGPISPAHTPPVPAARSRSTGRIARSPSVTDWTAQKVPRSAAEQAGVHSVPQSFINQECFILRSFIQPCQIRPRCLQLCPSVTRSQYRVTFFVFGMK